MVQTKKRFHDYYGNDAINEDDDESKKLILTDCIKQQQKLYSINSNNTDNFKLILQFNYLDSTRVYYSGISRLELYQQYKDKIDINLESFGIDLNDFTQNTFPVDTSEEYRLISSHNLPLLFIPKFDSQNELMYFLSKNYPDVHIWYLEGIKSISWLNKKWKPLIKGFGLSKESKSVIKTFDPDCLAINHIKGQFEWYRKYCEMIKKYFIDRLSFLPLFNESTLINDLELMKKQREEFVQNDSGFLKIVGNRFLVVFNNVTESSTSKFSIKSIANKISDEEEKKEFLAFFMNRKAAIQFLKENENGNDDLDYNSDNEEEGSENDEVNCNEPVNRPAPIHIIKNRGIIKYRHKRERNPRVHMKHKYKKALLRYRSRIAPVKTEETLYSGEKRGIRAHVSKSYKFNKKP